MDSKEFKSLLDKSKDILVIVPPSPTDDIFSSALATCRYLDRHKKDSTLVHDDDLPHRLNFLKIPDSKTNSLEGLREFVLIFNTDRNKIMDISSEQKEGEFIVRLTPAKGAIDPRDFSFAPADFKHDLLIILGTPNLDSLGSLYQSNTDLFFEVPKINIDNKSANESYGQANVIDLTASSISEICANLFIDHGEEHIDQHIAQSLLTGIISETESFQKPTTTPKAMITAAKLMKYKADQAQVIQHLFKTKSFSFLKLWGRVMARLNWDPETKTAWSLISTEDFVQSRAGEKDIPYVLEEIRKNFIEGDVFAVFYPDSSGKTIGQLHFANESKAQQLAQSYETGTAGSFLRVKLPQLDLLEAEKDFLKKIDELE